MNFKKIRGLVFEQTSPHQLNGIHRILVTFVFIPFVFLLLNCAGSASVQNEESPQGLSATIAKQEKIDSYDSRAIKHYMDGVNAEMQGDYAMAIVEFQEALRYDSSSATLYQDLSNSYIKLKKYDQAERTLKLGLKHTAEPGQLLAILGELYYITSQFDRARDTFTQVIESTDERELELQSLNYLADIHIRQNEYFKAAQIYEELYNKGLDDEEYLIKAESIYYQMEKYDDAKRILKILIDEYPDRDEFRLDLAQLYSETGKIDSAMTILKPLVQQDPGSDAASLMGEQLFQMGAIDSAYSVLKPLYDEDSTNVRVLYYLGGAALSNQNFESAKKYYSQLLEADDSILGGYYGLGVAYRGEQNYGESVDVLKKGLEKFQDEPELHKQLGITYYFMQQFDSARTSLQKSLAFDSSQVSPKHYLAFVYDQLGKQDSAIVMYKELLRVVPDDPLYMNNLAYIYALQGKNLKRALELVSKALEKEPENTSYLDTKGWVYFKLGRFERAKKFLEKALGFGGENAEVLEHLGDVYRKLGEDDKAKEYYQRAAQIDPTSASLRKKIN